jgi:hypothetical protein
LISRSAGGRLVDLARAFVAARGETLEITPDAESIAGAPEVHATTR